MKDKRSKETIADLFVFDAHCDTASALADNPWSFRRAPTHIDLAKAGKGGLKAQVFAIWVDPLFAPQRALKRGLQVLQAMEEKVFAPGLAAKVTVGRPTWTQAVSEGKLAAWLFLEGGHIIENSPEVLAVFRSPGRARHDPDPWQEHRLGRFLHRHAAFPGPDRFGPADRRPDGADGHGHRRVARLRRDRPRTCCKPWTSRSWPPIPTRAGCAPSPRNLPDDLIRAIAARGGFIGANFHPGLHQAPRLRADRSQLRALCRKRSRRGPGTGWTIPQFLSQIEWEYFQRAVVGNDPVFMDDLIDHIVHIAAIGGIDCVGLGSDFDGIASTPVEPEERRRLSLPWRQG